MSSVTFHYISDRKKTEKHDKTLKKMISTREWCAKHPLAGLNTQQLCVMIPWSYLPPRQPKSVVKDKFPSKS